MSKRAVRRGKRLMAGFRHAEGLEPRRMMTVTVGTPIVTAAATASAVQTVSLASAFSTDLGSIVRFTMQDGDTGTVTPVDIELYDKAWGGHTSVNTTTSNFLSYVKSGAYDSTFIHRAQNFANPDTNVASGDLPGEPSLFLQGGNFEVTTAGAVTAVATGAAIPLQYNAANPNAAMTISMARTTVENSATSGFFLNVADNTSIFGQQQNSTTGQLGGGYADFGTILTGQDALTGYAAAPRSAADSTPPFSTSVGKGAFGTLPLAGDGSISTSNLIYIRSATALDAFTYQLSSSDNSVVTPTLDSNGNLVLTYHGAGSATITLTATDYNGTSATTSFTATAGTSTDVSLGGAVTTLNYVDSDGTAATYTYTGPGAAKFTFINGQAATPVGKSITVSAPAGSALSLSSITITGSSSKSSLAVKLTGGSVAGTTAEAVTSATIGKLTLTGVTLGGTGLTSSIAGTSGAAIALGAISTAEVDVTGSLKSLTVGSVTNGTLSLTGSTSTLSVSAVTSGKIGVSGTASTVTLGALTSSTATVAGTSKTLTLGPVASSTVTVTGAVSTLTVGSATSSTVGVSGAASAMSVGTSTGLTLTTGGAAKSLALKGTFANGAVTVGGTVSSLTAAGAISGSTFAVTTVGAFTAPSLASTTISGTTLGGLTVKGAMSGSSTVSFTGNAGKISLGALTDSTISAASAVSGTIAGAMSNSGFVTNGPITTFSAGSITASEVQGSASSSVIVKGSVSGNSFIYFPSGPLLTFKADSLIDTTLAVGVSNVPTSVTEGNGGTSVFTGGNNSVIRTLTLGNKTASLSGSQIYVASVFTGNLGKISSAATQTSVGILGAGALKVTGPTGKVFSQKNVRLSTRAQTRSLESAAGLGSVDSTGTYNGALDIEAYG